MARTDTCHNGRAWGNIPACRAASCGVTTATRQRGTVGAGTHDRRMSTAHVALAIPPAVVLEALSTRRWRLSWSDEVYRPGATPQRRHRWMLGDLIRGGALLVESDRHGALRDHATYAGPDGDQVLHTEDEIRAIINSDRGLS